jgi:hypothetical protein
MGRVGNDADGIYFELVRILTFHLHQHHRWQKLVDFSLAVMRLNVMVSVHPESQKNLCNWASEYPEKLHAVRI